MRYEVVRELRDDAFKSDVRADFIIHLTGAKSRKLYPDELRLVKALDSDSGELITFITNNLDFYPQEMANIYRHRWDIEVQIFLIKMSKSLRCLTIYKFLCEFIATVLLLLIFYHFVTKSVQRYYIFS